ncbi:MAG: MarR family transcriptional regulator [Gammaproteobacteria bacterium]|nr:MarR family transcriptional regulator [Gammaproteobacteria bacterium]
MFERCLYFNSQNLARTVARIWTEEFSQYDLSPPHAYLLRLVLQKPGLLQREIASELGLSRSTVTRFIDSLEERGFLKRKSGTTDGREQAIYPARKAVTIAPQLEASGERLYREMQRIIGADQLQSFVSEMRKMQSELG